MNSPIYKQIAKNLQTLKDSGNYRTFLPLTREFTTPNYATNNKRTISVWCSNDYLGMSKNQSVMTAASEAITKYGVGSGGTRNISGNHTSITKLETTIASWVGKESALVFTSGYVSNEASLSALARMIPDAVFFSDSLNHNSIVQGLRLGKANIKIFNHNDCEHLEKLLKEVSSDTPKIIVFESVYSMEGAFGEVAKIAALAEKYNAFTFVDETHAVGLYGENGGGLVHKLGLTNKIDLIQGGLGKGVGTLGGFVAASGEVIDFIRSFGHGFIFTTSLPPVIAEAASASINTLCKMQSERLIIQEKANLLRSLLSKARIPFLDSTSHIVPVIVGDPIKVKKVSEELLNNFSHYLQPINSPTVPTGTERLRITLTPYHKTRDILDLVSSLWVIWQDLELPQTEIFSCNSLATSLEDEISELY